MRRITVLCAALLAIVASVAEAHACSCSGGPPESWAGRADAVFLGRPVAVGPSLFTPIGQGVVTTFVVDSVWKGNVRRRALVVTDLSSCGGYFPKGEPYLIFATSAGFGRYRTWECTGTAPARYSARAFAVLGTGASPRPRSWWSLIAAILGSGLVIGAAMRYARRRHERRAVVVESGGGAGENRQEVM